MDLHLTELDTRKARRMEKRRKISEYNTNLDLTKSVNFPVVVAAVEHEVGCIEAGIIRSRAVVGLPWVPRRGELVHCLVVDCPDPAKKEGRGLIRYSLGGLMYVSFMGSLLGYVFVFVYCKDIKIRKSII